MEPGSYWINAAGATTTACVPVTAYTTWGAADVPAVYYYNWPQQPQAASDMPPGWKCTDCGHVLAPWVRSHKCGDEGTAPVTAGPASEPPRGDVLYKTENT